MSDGWQAGDLALCIAGGNWHNQFGYNPEGPEFDKIYRVTEVSHQGLFLAFAEWKDQCWDRGCFRKIPPDVQQGDIHDWELLLDSMSPKVPANA